MSVAIADLMAAHGSPLYVYDLAVVRERAAQLQAAFTYKDLQFLYAIKANPCPPVARCLIEAGFGIDCVSPGEMQHALRLGVAADKILYTENNMTDAEMHDAIAAGVLINCGSLDRLERLAKAGAKTAAVRFNPHVGDGMHEKVLTAGPLTKFGVYYNQVDQVRRIEDEYGIHVVGCHMHIGSGVLNADIYVEAMKVILDVASQLPHLTFINFGGGIGIPYKESDEAIDLQQLGAAATTVMEDFCASYGRTVELRLEPGRFLVGEAGSLYSTVTSVKQNPDGRVYVGCDTGFNHLVRPCMYNSYHAIENISHPNNEPIAVDVVGNICESGDVFARQRTLPRPELNDILAIRSAGAYGMSMASTYNMRPLPAEIVIDGDSIVVAKKQQALNELLEAWDC